MFFPHCYNDSGEPDDLKGIKMILKGVSTALATLPKSSAPQNSWHQSLGLWRTGGKKERGEKEGGLFLAEMILIQGKGDGLMVFRKCFV